MKIIANAKRIAEATLMMTGSLSVSLSSKTISSRTHTKMFLLKKPLMEV